MRTDWTLCGLLWLREVIGKIWALCITTRVYRLYYDNDEKLDDDTAKYMFNFNFFFNLYYLPYTFYAFSLLTNTRVRFRFSCCFNIYWDEKIV